MDFCTQCGSRVVPESKFCGGCGKPVDGPPSPDKAPAPADASRDFDDALAAMERMKKMRQEKKRFEEEMEAMRKKQESDLKIREFQEMELARLREQNTFMNQQMAMLTGSIERVLALAGETGTLDSATIQEAFKQQTLQKAQDRSEDVAVAFAEADGKRNGLDTFKAGLEEGKGLDAPSGGCSGCGKDIEPGWKRCPFCGKDL